MADTLITEQHVAFLRLIKSGQYSRGATTREDDRIRQTLRREGFAAYVGTPRRWQISDKGVGLLNEWDMGHD